ncbi:uncharacterized protein LOC120345471 [Styela clava]|uniref:uncharacterized protein LOC120345471 n=1 Tax=Styela clava TaxID=7725 RepID=UPI0019398E4A|nr:uncharacterized protein LOC120345471 [Styela clava]
MYVPTSPMDDEIEDENLRQIDNNSAPISLSDYNFEMDYIDDREIVILHHNLYHLTLQAKLRVFLVLFVIIVIPATIVFTACYIRDRRKQRRYERDVAANASESPDHTLPYSARLSRPVPGTATELTPTVGRPRSMRVSFADEREQEGRRSAVSNSKHRPSLPDSPEETDDDVFFVDSSTNKGKVTRPVHLPSESNSVLRNETGRRKRTGSR